MPQPFIPIPDVARFELVYSIDAQVVENVFHVKHPGGWTVADLTNTAELFCTWWVSHMRTDVSNNVSFNRILGTDQSAQTGPRIEYVSGLPSIGLNSDGQAVPNHVTVVVKWLTAQRGRSYRGRTYHVGLRSGHFDTNTITSSFANTLNTVYGLLITAVEGSGSDRLVVPSRYALGTARVTGISTEIVACAVDRTIDSQRRRLPGRGQ